VGIEGWIERLWKAGKMGSKECLQNQLKSVRVTKGILLRYLSTIKLDPHIHRLVAMLERNGIKPVIVSDSFSPIIEAILKTNGIKGVKVCSNHLRFYKNHLVPLFPHKNGRCFLCAHCKKKNLRKHNMEDKIIIYVGDGLSDICPAQYADIVFAKGRLLNYFRKKKMLCIAFKDFEDIYDYLRRLER